MEARFIPIDRKRQGYVDTEAGSEPIESNPSGATISKDFDPVTFTEAKKVPTLIKIALAYLGFKYFL